MSLLLLGALLAAAPAPAPAADLAIGRWKTETKNGVVEIQRCGASICGRLLTSDLLRQRPDLKDGNNQNAAQRNRPLKGLLLISGLPPSPTHGPVARSTIPTTARPTRRRSRRSTPTR